MGTFDIDISFKEYIPAFLTIMFAGGLCVSNYVGKVNGYAEGRKAERDEIIKKLEWQQDLEARSAAVSFNLSLTIPESTNYFSVPLSVVEKKLSDEEHSALSFVQERESRERNIALMHLGKVYANEELIEILKKK